MSAPLPTPAGQSIAHAMFRLKRPCGGCPFTAGGVELEPGRLEGIVSDLLADDQKIFHCHETVYSDRLGGEFDDEGNYCPSHRESFCAGAMVVLERMGRPSVAQRLGRALGYYDPEVLMQNAAVVVRPTHPGDRCER